MKKKVLAIATTLILTFGFSFNEENVPVDCFQEAINDLNEFESYFGAVDEATATEILNLSYAICFCTYEADDPIEIEACFGN